MIPRSETLDKDWAIGSLSSCHRSWFAKVTKEDHWYTLHIQFHSTHSGDVFQPKLRLEVFQQFSVFRLDKTKHMKLCIRSQEEYSSQHHRLGSLRQSESQTIYPR